MQGYKLKDHSRNSITGCTSPTRTSLGLGLGLVLLVGTLTTPPLVLRPTVNRTMVLLLVSRSTSGTG